MPAADTQLSVVIPVHNEERNLPRLYERLVSTLEKWGGAFEIVAVDDSSSDGSAGLLKNLACGDGRLKLVRLRRNFGQTAALAAGFEYARGAVIVAMDGDLQHAPEDIPALLAKLDEGYDIANGRRERRSDNLFTRRIPSRLANACIRWISGVELHDFGGTFKAYRSEAVKNLRLYGELHRFIPVLAAVHGARIAEVPIQDCKRGGGRSHYGLGRAPRVLFDLIAVGFLARYLTRPMHFFGSIGLLCGGAGAALFAYLLGRKILGAHIAVEHGPLLIAAAVLALGGVQMVCTGLIGEMLTRSYFESGKRAAYDVREVIAKDEPRT